MISQVPLETDKCACIVSVVVASDVAAVVCHCHCCCSWQNLLRFYVQPPFSSLSHPPHSHLLANKRLEGREPSDNDNDASTDNAPKCLLLLSPQSESESESFPLFAWLLSILQHFGQKASGHRWGENSPPFLLNAFRLCNCN